MRDISVTQRRVRQQLRESLRGYLTWEEIRALHGTVRTVHALVRRGYAEVTLEGQVARRWREDMIDVLLPAWMGDVSCGLRADLPKKKRRHYWAYLGPDWANHGEQGIVQVDVFACLRCGKDKR
jgi:hypothetical protein